MTRVYFIRHAQAEGNLHHTVQGNREVEITPLGREQIAALSRRFADIPVDAVFSSDLKRAVETAQAISRPRGVPLYPEKAFREVDFGTWEGRAWDDLAAEQPEQVENFNEHLEKFQAPGGETAAMLLRRFMPALERIVKEYEGGTVAIVSHGLALRIVLGALRGLSPAEIRSLHGPNTAVSLVEWEGEKPTVVYQDDGSHVLHLGGAQVQGKGWWK